MMEDRAVSLNAVLNEIDDLNADGGFAEYGEYSYLFDKICGLPSVLQSKTGQWVKKKGGNDNYYYECSKCGCLSPYTEYADSIIWKKSNYCPDCGSIME